ncbi:MAG: exodeoxyribonuclease III [Patescibacteria group bacterium]
MKLYSFNVNGIRAIGRKGFWEWLYNTQPDILCIQEIKADDLIMAQLKSEHPEIKLNLLNNLDDNALINEADSENGLEYNLFWHSCTMKKGYSGTAILFKKNLFKSFTRKIGIGNQKFDIEGRMTILENEKFCLFNGYFPQGGREGRVAYKIEFYEELLELLSRYKNEGKKIIVCGDLNTTVTDIDLARPKENRNTTGCLPEEREVLQKYFDFGLIDSFRYFYPDLAGKYSYWDQITRARERNVGWRIDYFLVDKELRQNMVDAQILDQVFGSDHCPVLLELDI